MGKPKVLIIDDEPLLVKSTCMALRISGLDARGAPDGLSGLKEAETWKPDIVLLDVMMPEMDGWQVLEQLQETPSLRNTPVVMFTAREYANGKQLARSHGAVDYVPKPFEPVSLIEVIRRYVSSTVPNPG